jgi:hypothetical protein
MGQEARKGEGVYLGLSSEEEGRGKQRVTFMTAALANVTSPFGASVSILSCRITQRQHVFLSIASHMRYSTKHERTTCSHGHVSGDNVLRILEGKHVAKRVALAIGFPRLSLAVWKTIYHCICSGVGCGVGLGGRLSRSGQPFPSRVPAAKAAFGALSVGPGRCFVEIASGIRFGPQSTSSV